MDEISHHSQNGQNGHHGVISSQKIVRLNVGGSKFTTSKTTLTAQPDSMLSRMFSGKHPIIVDGDGSYFIDRDGSCFQHILNYLRDGSLPPPEMDTAQKVILEREARYFLLDELREVLEEEIQKDRMHLSQIQFLRLYNGQVDKKGFLCCSSLRLPNADLSTLQLDNATFSDSELHHTLFRGTTFTSIVFDKANLEEADFSGARFINTTRFRGARLRGARFEGALAARGAAPDFAGADLRGADFTNAEMPGADFTGCCCDGADFTGALLTGVAVGGGASFKGAVLRGAVCDDRVYSELLAAGAEFPLAKSPRTGEAPGRSPSAGSPPLGGGDRRGSVGGEDGGSRSGSRGALPRGGRGSSGRWGLIRKGSSNRW